MSTDPISAPQQPGKALVQATGLAAFAVLAVLLRGLRWDETWEHAQILSGAVAYPEGHPLALYVHNAFSLQTWAAGQLALLGPAANSLLRNALFLLASIAPVFALATTLTRRPLAGILAATLLLQGILLEFDGSYPTMVWPELYSNGHIGGGAVLLALAALLAGWRRSAFFLAGFLPAVHVGQWPPLAGVAILFVLFHATTGRRRRDTAPDPALPQCLGWAAACLGATALFWLVHRATVLPLPDTGPFAVRAGAEAVWRGYTALHDPHRAFPPGNGHIILAGTLLLGALAACGGATRPFRVACAWLAAFCGMIAAAVWGIMAIHAPLGPDIPFLLIAWMPYRLINLVPSLTLAILVAAILLRWPICGWWCLTAALAAGVLQPLWPLLLGNSLHQRYLAGGEFVAFALYGLAFFAVAPRQGRGRVAAIVLAFTTTATLAGYHQFGAACMVAGLAAGYALYRWDQHQPNAARKAPHAAAIGTAIAAAALLVHQFHYRQHLPVTPFLAQVRQALEGTHALLAGPPDSILLQATTGQPILAEAATPSLISYVPAIGPAIDQLYRDLYGHGFTIPAPGDPDPVSWTDHWRQHGPAGWREMAGTYGLTHVIAPTGLDLLLEPVVTAPDYTLYALDAP